MTEEVDVTSSGLGNSAGPDSEPHKSAYGYKSQLKWTPELHARFVEAVERCGGHKNATPKQVQMYMNVEGVSVIHVKSHLQKHRLKMKEVDGGSLGGQVHTPGFTRQMHGDAAALGMPGAVRAVRQDGSINGALYLGMPQGGGEPSAKRMRPNGSGLLGAVQEAAAAGMHGAGAVGGQGGGRGLTPGAGGVAEGGGGIRPLPRSTLADLAMGGDQLYQIAQGQQGSQPFPPFKPTGHLAGFSSLSQLPPSILTAAAAAAATGLDWSWIGQLAAGGGPGALAGANGAPADSAGVPVPAFSLPLPSPLAAPASYPAAATAGAQTEGGEASAGETAGPPAAGQGGVAGSDAGTPAVAGAGASAASASLAMTGEGLQLLAQLAAASGITPLVAPAAGGPEAREGAAAAEEGAVAGGVLGRMETIQGMFTRLQVLLQQQGRMQLELQAVGQSAMQQLAQLRSAVEAYLTNISAIASALSAAQHKPAQEAQHPLPGGTAAADGGGAGLTPEQQAGHGAQDLRHVLTAAATSQDDEHAAHAASAPPAAAAQFGGMDMGEGGEPAAAATAAHAPSFPSAAPSTAAASFPLTSAMGAGAALFWDPSAAAASAPAPPLQPYSLVGSQPHPAPHPAPLHLPPEGLPAGAMPGAAGAEGVPAQHAQQVHPQQPSTLAALGELLKGGSAGGGPGGGAGAPPASAV